MLRILLVVFAAAACSSETDCSDSSCSCSTTADCPSDYACAAAAEPGQQVCYPRGKYPLGTSCSAEDDCDPAASLDCQDGLHICVQRCGAGFPSCPSQTACQGTNCMPFGSLPWHSTCDDSRLCGDGSQCIFGTCTIFCNEGYAIDVCTDGLSYCAVNETPTCTPPAPACSASTPCVGDRVCIEVGGGLGICRRPCTYDVDASSVYSDTCLTGIGSYERATCAPMGETNVAACIEAPNSGGQNGATCNNGTQLCGKGHVCLASRCRALCSGVSTCAVGTCTAIAPGFTACTP